MIRNPLIAGALALAAVVAVGPVAQAQTTYTWNGGGGDNNWSTAANWTASAGSPPPVSDATNTLIVLDGITRLTNTVDLLSGTGGGPFDINSLTFAAGAGAFVVNPTATNVTTLRVGTGGVTVVSNNNQTVAAPFALSAAQTWANNGTGMFLASGAIDLGANLLTAGGTGNATFGGVVSGAGGLTKAGAGILTLGGVNTYTGITTISGGVLATPTLANGGANSGIGASTSVAGNLVLDGGTLRHTGGASTTDRLFTLTQNGGTIEASGTGTLTFSSAGTVAFTGSGTRTLTLGGTNTGLNVFGPNLGDGTGGATSVTKSGAGVWVLPFANAYTGTTTVSAGTLAINRPTAGATPVGTGPINLNGGTLTFAGNPANPLTVTGFNFDTISSASDNAAGGTFGVNKSLDSNGADGGGGFPNGWVLYEINALFANNRGLPTNRTIVSAANPLNTYLLQPYGTGGTIANNTLQLNPGDVEGGGNTGTLTLTTGAQYEVVSLLTTGGGGAVNYRVRLNFSDSTFTEVDVRSPDWFNNTPFAIDNLDRMDRQGFPQNVGSTNPRLYAQDIALSPADQAKTLTSIGLTRLSGGRLNVYGVSGVAPGGGATSYANPVAVTADSGLDLLNTASLTFGQLTIGTNTLTTNGPASSIVSFPSTILTGNPTFNVNGVSQILNSGPLDYGSATRTITKSGGGTMVLGAAAVNATAINQLTVTGGIANVTNATALGTAPNLNVTGGTANLGPVTGLTTATVSGGTANLPSVTTIPTATISGGTTNLDAGVAIGTATVNGGTVNLGTAAAGAASSATRLAGTGGTVALLGTATPTVLTIGSANQNDSFAGSFTGPGSVVKVGTGTQTLTSTGSTFAGGLTVSAGKVVATRPGSLGTGAVSLANGTALSIGGTPGASILGFNGNGTGWNLQGGAAVSGDVLTITTNANNQARSAWFNTKQPTAAFTASFNYSRVGGSGNPADGATFTIQNQSATALGTGGGGLGYGGITPSASLQLNIYNPNGRGIAFRTNGAVAGGGNYTATTPAVDIFNSGPGSEVKFDLVYDGTNLNVKLTQGANTFDFPAQALDLTTLLGANAWVGFTGATGGENANQLFSNFVFNLTGTSPPPVSTYVNGVNVAAGASATINPLIATNVATFTMGPLGMGSGATLNLQPETGSLADTAYNLTLGATTLAGPATFNVSNNGTGAGTLTLGALADGGTGRTIAKDGAGILTLAGAAASLVDGTAVNVNTGTLRVTDAAALGNLAAVTLAASTNFSLGANQTVGSLAGTGGVSLNGNTLTIGSSNNLNSTYGGVIVNGSAPGGLGKGGNGTVTLTGANTYSGTTTLAAGTLVVGNATALGTTSGVVFTTGSTGTLRLNGNPYNIGGLSGPAGTVENANAAAIALTAGGGTDTAFGGV
ncbi:MAG TPA: autotransporter-associated beta strand repeat-containing protein, partial [Fimbriiglobus sp.]|nr:autotransporter-associated beta strand repeat-containing protein [Fimbriiglobus sp.]